MKVCVCDSVVTRYNELPLYCEHTAPNQGQPNLVSSIPSSSLKFLITYGMSCCKVIKNRGREGLGVKLTQL